MNLFGDQAVGNQFPAVFQPAQHGRRVIYCRVTVRVQRHHIHIAVAVQVQTRRRKLIPELFSCDHIQTQIKGKRYAADFLSVFIDDQAAVREGAEQLPRMPGKGLCLFSGIGDAHIPFTVKAADKDLFLA